MPRPPRIVLAKAGLDAHERGIHVLGLGLRDAGMEVIYLGLRVTPEELVRVAIEEDADVIGISSLAGAHKRYTLEVLRALKANGADTTVVLGGLIPEADRQELVSAGVARVFGQGSSVQEIAAYLRAQVQAQHEAVEVR